TTAIGAGINAPGIGREGNHAQIAESRADLRPGRSAISRAKDAAISARIDRRAADEKFVDELVGQPRVDGGPVLPLITGTIHAITKESGKDRTAVRDDG